MESQLVTCIIAPRDSSRNCIVIFLVCWYLMVSSFFVAARLRTFGTCFRSACIKLKSFTVLFFLYSTFLRGLRIFFLAFLPQSLLSFFLFLFSIHLFSLLCSIFLFSWSASGKSASDSNHTVTFCVMVPLDTYVLRYYSNSCRRFGSLSLLWVLKAEKPATW